MKGLISFEGVEGCGKTTQLRLLWSWLVSRGERTLATREPGGTSLGLSIRKAVLHNLNQALAREAELFLYLADRAQHVREVIKPALMSEALVLCDRFSDSTLAYQGFGRGFEISLLERLNALCTDNLIPDITFLLDCPIRVGLQRAKERLRLQGSKEGRFETEPIEFHERVREGFLMLARGNPKRFVVLDAECSIPDVQGQIASILLRKLGG
jgi:dTMP kinase